MRKIAIISGEGEQGSPELYKGKDTDRAIKMRLTRERCNGDRWARAVVYAGATNYGGYGIDFESGHPCSWPLSQ